MVSFIWEMSANGSLIIAIVDDPRVS
jgi:hypothetical protein